MLGYAQHSHTSSSAIIVPLDPGRCDPRMGNYEMAAPPIVRHPVAVTPISHSFFLSFRPVDFATINGNPVAAWGRGFLEDSQLSRCDIFVKIAIRDTSGPLRAVGQDGTRGLPCHVRNFSWDDVTAPATCFEDSATSLLTNEGP